MTVQTGNCKQFWSNCILLGEKLSPWLLLLGWAAVIFLFSAQPYSGQATEKIFGILNVPVRKCGHMVEYAMLAILSRRSWLKTFTSTKCSPTIAAFLITLLYALSDEWHQSFIPGRSATLSDVAVDAAGAAVGLAVSMLLCKKSRTARVDSRDDRRR